MKYIYIFMKFVNHIVPVVVDVLSTHTHHTHTHTQTHTIH